MNKNKNKVEIVVVNSLGPMGSSLISAIVEKLGYLNLPVRKVDLHKYLLGQLTVDQDNMKLSYINHIKNHSELINLGGVSVEDRKSNKPKRILDNTMKHKIISYITNTNYNSISSMFNDLQLQYAKAIIYKKLKSQEGLHVHMTTDIAKIDKPEVLFKKYNENFHRVKFINLRRDFVSWVESIISQNFDHPNLRLRLKFSLNSLYKSYVQYNNNISHFKGIIINTDDIFIRTETITEEIENFLGKNFPLDYKKETYDLYSQICSYNKAFTKDDFPGKYISNFSIFFINFSQKNSKIIFLLSLVYSFIYIFELLRFKYLSYYRNKAT